MTEASWQVLYWRDGGASPAVGSSCPRDALRPCPHCGKGKEPLTAITPATGRGTRLCFRYQLWPSKLL